MVRRQIKPGQQLQKGPSTVFKARSTTEMALGWFTGGTRCLGKLGRLLPNGSALVAACYRLSRLAPALGPACDTFVSHVNLCVFVWILRTEDRHGLFWFVIFLLFSGVCASLPGLLMAWHGLVQCATLCLTRCAMACRAQMHGKTSSNRQFDDACCRLSRLAAVLGATCCGVLLGCMDLCDWILLRLLVTYLDLLWFASEWFMCVCLPQILMACRFSVRCAAVRFTQFAAACRAQMQGRKSPKRQLGELALAAVSKIMEHHTCPISLQLLVDPVVAEDGVVYERRCIERWLKERKASPVTNQEMGPTLLPTPAARQVVANLVEEGLVDADAALDFFLDRGRVLAAQKAPSGPDLQAASADFRRALALAKKPGQRRVTEFHIKLNTWMQEGPRLVAEAHADAADVHQMNDWMAEVGDAMRFALLKSLGKRSERESVTSSDTFIWTEMERWARLRSPWPGLFRDSVA